MSGETLAKIHWRALDRDGEDKCRLARLDGGYMLVGHARFHDSTGWAALDYLVRLGADWRTLSADISGDYGGDTVAWKLVNHSGDWLLNDIPQPDLQGAEDIDLSFTPATNLMPLRRLPQVGRILTRAVWLRLPGPQVSQLSQSYTRERGGLVRYVAQESAFETQLVTDTNGFVTTYPGLWEQVDLG